MTNYILKQCFTYPPIITIISIISLIFIHIYISDYTNWKYGNPTLPNYNWYTPLSASLVHKNDWHLINNVISILLCGTLYEITEGPIRYISIWISSSAIGFGFHGILKPNTYALGASGVVYGLIWSQLSILLLNWKEMPLKYVRLIIIILLFIIETVLYNTNFQSTIAYGAHWGGALAGITVSTVLSANVIIRLFEIFINWFGVILYCCIILFLYLYEQYNAADISVTIIFILIVSSSFQTIKYLRYNHNVDNLDSIDV